ncbi:MAG: cobalamin biosynthesis protein [Methylocella sp.]|jgi:cobalt-precorrin 5A hydrolase
MKIAIGIGCRKGCSSEAIVALVRRALERAGFDGAQREDTTAAIFTHQAKRIEAGLFAAAAELALPLVFLDEESLRAAAPRAASKSEKVMALFDLPSIAETAALAGAGAGATLLAPRISAAGVSCAIAKGAAP